jgi:pimeloyl-ACP methyl ester carboxylesterase
MSAVFGQTPGSISSTGLSLAEGGKPVVLLVHGMWSHPGIWHNFRLFLEARGYRVVVPALRHHDAAPGDPAHPALGSTSIADYFSDLVAIAGKLGEKPFVIGHSMGGLLAQMLAARGLARAVVGLAPAPSAGTLLLDHRPFWFFRRETIRPFFWRRPQLPSLDSMRYGVLNRVPPREQEGLYAGLLPESGRAVCEIAYWFLDRQRTTWINPADVACPMLFLTGTDDRLTPLWVTERNAEPYGDRLKVEALKGHAHWLPAEPGWERIAERAAHFFEKEAAVMARKLAWRQRGLPAGELAPAG